MEFELKSFQDSLSKADNNQKDIRLKCESQEKIIEELK